MKKPHANNEKFLSNMAQQLINTARILREVRERMEKSADLQRRTTERIKALNASLQSSMAERKRKRNFTYREYLEFTSAEEFEHFKALPNISDSEIREVDVEALIKALLEETDIS
ncbi:MAG: hypothetical protein JXA52_02990 [Planctomycetes bacterium]|nr:hypothetical protein [Planctomycetota bacterium]